MQNVVAVDRTIHTASTVRGGRVMYRQAKVTVAGHPGLSIHEADTTGSLAAGEWPEGILFTLAVGESLAVADYTGTLSVVKFGIVRCEAGEAMDPATVKAVSWDNQGRIRAATGGVDYIIGELVGAKEILAAGEECEVFVNIFAWET